MMSDKHFDLFAFYNWLQDQPDAEQIEIMPVSDEFEYTSKDGVKSWSPEDEKT